jgi:hypothetical protein
MEDWPSERNALGMRSELKFTLFNSFASIDVESDSLLADVGTSIWAGWL